MNSEDAVGGAALLVERARTTVPGYGRRVSGTCDIAALLDAHRTQLVERRFESAVTGMALPAGDGEHVIGLDSSAARMDILFTVRHELAHIIAGEVEEALFLTSEDTLSFSERRADLFALADLTPSGWLRSIGAGRRPWTHVTLDVAQAYRELTAGWSEQRIWDRAHLRAQLYRRYQI